MKDIRHHGEGGDQPTFAWKLLECKACTVKKKLGWPVRIVVVMIAVLVV